MTGKPEFSSEAVHSFVDELFGEDLHAKRVTSLAKATVGTLQASSLAVSAIGHGLALAQGGLSRHAIKQVDGMLSNDGIDVFPVSTMNGLLEDTPMSDDAYFRQRAEAELERAQAAAAPEVVLVHYQLAEAYLAKLADPADRERDAQ